MDIGKVIEEGDRVIEVPDLKPVEQPAPVREPEPSRPA
jgi:hypothetical protein